MTDDRHAGFELQMRPRYGRPGVGFRPARVPVVVWQCRVMAVDTRATARWLAVDCALGDRWQRVGRSQQPSDYLILADATDDELDQINRDVQERIEERLVTRPLLTR